jgi:hypothetical protein
MLPDFSRADTILVAAHGVRLIEHARIFGKSPSAKKYRPTSRICFDKADRICYLNAGKYSPPSYRCNLWEIEMLSKTALILTVVLLLLVSTLMATTTPNPSTTIQKMNQMPLAFTKNMGQWDERVLFRANAGGATMWFTKEGVTYQFTRSVPRQGTPQLGDC